MACGSSNTPCRIGKCFTPLIYKVKATRQPWFWFYPFSIFYWDGVVLLPDLLPHNQFPNILLWTAVTRCHRICVRSTLVHQNLHAAALLCKQDKQSCRCQCRGCAENHDERGFELGEKSTGNENQVDETKQAKNQTAGEVRGPSPPRKIRMNIVSSHVIVDS